MKLSLALLVICVSVLLSCNKEGAIKADAGCIERKIIPVHNHGINAAEAAVADNLFTTNNTDNSRYRYYQFSRDSIQTYFSPYEKFSEIVVKVDEYTNGLRIFTNQLFFGFKNNAFNFKSGEPTKGTALNNIPKLSLKELRKNFIDNCEQFDHNGSQYKDSCLSAEFGYFNTNSATGNTKEHLVKAWKITLKGSIYPSEYPQACYNDETGKLIYYDNGIRTVR